MQNLQIHTACPQCGGAVEIHETEHVIDCPYCRVKTLLLPHNVFRYYIAPKEGISEPMLFFPYWRFRGQLFSVETEQVHSKMMDLNFIAGNWKEIPYSLGVRTQTLHVIPIHPKMNGRLIREEMPLQEVRSRVGHMAKSSFEMRMKEKEESDRKESIHPGSILTARVDYFNESTTGSETAMRLNSFFETLQNRNKRDAGIPIEPMQKLVYEQEFIGETINMVYFPYFIKNGQLMDGVLDKPVIYKSDSLNELNSIPQHDQAYAFKHQPLICSQCGWDLQGFRDSIFFFCANCGQGWMIYQNDLKACKYQFMNSEEKSIHLPFWKIKVKIAGIAVQEYEHQRLTTFRFDESAREERIFYVPAFRILTEIFLRLARAFNSTRSDLETVPFQEQTYFPATLPLSEAVESIFIILSQMSDVKKRILENKEKIQIDAKQAILEYHPFRQLGMELQHAGMGFSFYKTAFRDLTRIEDISKQ